MLSPTKLAVAFFLATSYVACSDVFRRFDYKLSFKGPHLVVMDGSIPFWEYGGHAIASDESVRITPSLRSKKGYIWSKQKKSFENWEIEVTFRVSGRGRIGADGLAIWYTEDRMIEGPVFGNQDQWKGLGLFFDSFDNDNLHNNPTVVAMVNDGTRVYDHNTDGSNQQLASCVRDFRNRPFPVKAKIEYNQRTLTVMIHNGLTTNKDDFELCARVEDVELPAEGYFGVSAATGGLADDHDVFSFITHQLIQPADSRKEPPTEQLSPGDRKKYEEEFDEYSQKLQKAKEEYQKEHPDAKPHENVEDDKFFESPDITELKLIFEGQNSIHTAVRSINQRIDELVGRQERTLSALTLLSQQKPPAPLPNGQQGQGQAPAVASPIQRHEVDSLLTSIRDLAQQTRDLKQVTDTVLTKVNSQQGQGHGGGSQDFGSMNPLQQQLSTDVKIPLQNLQNDVRQLLARPAPERPAPCPPVEAPNCVSSITLLIFLVIQAVVFFAYSFYKSSREAAAKKFY